MFHPKCISVVSMETFDLHHSDQRFLWKPPLQPWGVIFKHTSEHPGFTSVPDCCTCLLTCTLWFNIKTNACTFQIHWCLGVVPASFHTFVFLIEVTALSKTQTKAALLPLFSTSFIAFYRKGTAFN